jgi:acetoin utilization deacetylase AcuC-like enzyme
MPESGNRLRRIHDALDHPQFDELERHSAPLCEESDILLVHSPNYLERVKSSIPTDLEFVLLDPDTYLSPYSLAAAYRAVGASVNAIDKVISGEATNAFCAIRPPGHHARFENAMGFCIFGNAAIAARHAIERHGMSRVAVIDFDVHHGNGTQDLLWSEPHSLFISSHQSPLYPGTGGREETGEHQNVLNIPLPVGCDGDQFRDLMKKELLPRLDTYAPELIIISAGFDAHRADPLAEIELEVDDFIWITHALCDIADEHSKGRIVSILEGGYDLDALGESVAAHVDVLMTRGGSC